MHYNKTQIIFQIESEIFNRKAKKVGQEIFFLCPLPDHDDRNPSCSWNAEKQCFYCHACGTGGSWFTLADHLGILEGGVSYE